MESSQRMAGMKKYVFTLGKVLRCVDKKNHQGCYGKGRVTGSFRGDLGKEVDIRLGESLREQQVS